MKISWPLLFALGLTILIFIKCNDVQQETGMSDTQIMAQSSQTDRKSPRFSPDGKWILFKANRDGQNGLIKMNTNTREEQVLYETEGYLCCYNFSRDGRYITFTAFDGDLEVFRMHEDGSELKQVTNNQFYDGGALWTYDNAKLILTSVHEGEFSKAGIYSINPDGSARTRLHDLDFRAFDPSISHSGDYVLAQHNDESNLNIYSIAVETGEFTRLTQSDSADWYPEWSPDDQKIAYRNNESGDWDIYVMNPDGSNRQRLTDSPAEDRVPVWSPDGRFISYQSKLPDQEGFDIWIMHADGSNQRNITQDLFDNQDPNWSADAEKIVYSSKVGDYWQVMIINIDGSGKRLLRSD